MTLDFSTLIPLPAPGNLPDSAVTVGEKINREIPQLLSSFEKSLRHPDETPALVVTTSGSTGIPKQTVLSSRALKASARATEAFVGVQNAQWLLALPAHYVAGAQVLARSVLAGTTPVIAESILQNKSFTADIFLDAATRLSGRHTMVSLVPAQLHTLFEAADAGKAEILPALRSFSGLLLGGAPASAALVARARQENINLLRTYGSAETAGGCVYEGKPLDGVRVEVGPDGRIWLGGPTLASGYLDDSQRTAEHFFIDQDGERWYRTDDVGSFAGILTVTGRSDDVLISGGVKLSPSAIAEVLEEHPAVREAFVTGVDDARWGSAVCAAVSVRERPENLAETLVQTVKDRLGKPAAPKHLELLESFPVLSTGKPDRKQLKALLEEKYEGKSI